MVDGQALPRVQSAIAQRFEGLDLALETRDAAHSVQRHERERQQRGDDHEELQDLVVDRRGQPTQRDVDEHQRRRDEDREGHRPAEHQVDDQGQREQVDAGDEDGGEGEGAGVERVRGLVEAQPQVLGHRTDLGPEVERHHHDAEEDHRRHGAEPVVVDRRHAVLGAVGGLPRISSAPRLAAMKAGPVIQAGSERPERKKSRSVLIESRATNPTPSTTTK
jgi:hypothetical protein